MNAGFSLGQGHAKVLYTVSYHPFTRAQKLFEESVI